MKQAETLANLRHLLAPQTGQLVPLGHGPCDRMLGGGIARGALHEIFAADADDATTATGFSLGMAARLTPGKPLFWIRQDFSALEQGEPCAAGLTAFGIDPAQLVMVRVTDAKMGLRACGEVLACAGVGTVLFELTGKAAQLDLAASRRLTLAAQQKNVGILVLRLHALPEPSAAATRWRIAAASGPARFDAELTRNRHGGTGRWFMEWNNEQRIFRDGAVRNGTKQAAYPGLVAAAASDGPAHTRRVFTL